MGHVHVPHHVEEEIRYINFLHSSNFPERSYKTVGIQNHLSQGSGGEMN